MKFRKTLTAFLAVLLTLLLFMIAVPVQKTEAAKVYTITYVLHGGTNSSKNPASYMKSDTAIVLETPTKQGYTFVGWFSDEAMTKQTTGIKAGGYGNKTFYAKWAVNHYSIKFHGNGKTSGSTAGFGSISYTKKVTIPACGFLKTGYVFSGWNTKKDGTGTMYMPGDEVKGLKKADGTTLTLYAYWKPVTYKVCFKPGYGTGSMSKQTFTYDQEKKLSANAFTNANMTFTGWNTKLDGSGTAYNDCASVVNLASDQGAVVNLYARWKLSGIPEITETERGRNGAYNKITYKKVSGREVYQIYRSKTGETGSFKKIGETTSTSYKDKTAEAGVKYYYKVRAKGKNNTLTVYSEYSAAKTITTAVPISLTGSIVTGTGSKTGTIAVKLTNKSLKKIVVTGAFGTYYQENGSCEIGSIWPTEHVFDNLNYETEIAGQNVSISAGATKTFYIAMVKKVTPTEGGYLTFWVDLDGFSYLVKLTHNKKLTIQ